MKPARAATFAAILSLFVAYLSCGPLPCNRSSSARCGLLAYDYGSDATWFPAQAVVTMLVSAFVVGVLVWFVKARGRPPTVVRLLAGVVLVVATLAANAGIGGLIGIGAPFILPVLWLAARHSRPWARALWISLAGLSGAVGSWIIAEPLGLESNEYFAAAVGGLTVAAFVLTTRPSIRQAPS